MSTCRFLLLDGDHPVGVFTGGSLIVGAAARTDLVDPDRTEELARAQYRSLQRLLELPDDGRRLADPRRRLVLLRPGRGRADQHHRRRARQQPAVTRARDEDAFVAELLDSLGSYPPYFHRLGEANRRGPAATRPGSSTCRR